jgi:prevent-host-death family protein
MTKFREIAAGEFKAKCLKLMDSVQRTKTPLIITKHGKPVVKMVAADSEADDFFGCMKGSVQVVGDIVSPIDVEWEANG